MKNKLYRWALSLLGFSAIATSCEKLNPDKGGTIVMYGVPTTTYTLKGKVTDVNSKPIPGIRVGSNAIFSNNEAGYKALSTFTDANGNYTLVSRNLIDNNIPIVFTDVDGSENGIFSEGIHIVEIKNEDYEHTGSWTSSVTKTQDATLALSNTETTSGEIIITGKVIDDKGSPVINSRVHFFDFRVPTNKSITETNDKGEYSFKFDHIGIIGKLNVFVYPKNTALTSKDAQIEFATSDYKNGDGSFMGTAEKTLDFTLIAWRN